MAQAPRDQNHIPSLLLESSSTPGTVITAKGDQVTGRLLVDSASGSGTVTSVSVVSANGFAGSVATATTTPAITLSTTVTAAALAGNGTAISAATTTGSGSTVVLATSPALVTPNLGTPTVLVLTAATGLPLTTGVTGTLPATNGGTGQSTYTKGDILASPGSNALNKLGIGTDGFILTADAASTNGLKWATPAAGAITVGTTVISSGTTTRILYDNAGVVGEYTLTGTGTVVAMATSPAFTTPNIGAATATSVNGLTITSSTGVLTITNGKTLAATHSLTLSGTDSTVMTFPTTSKTIAANDGSNWTLASQAIGDLAVASSTTAYARLAAVAAGQVLISAGTGTAPAWSAAPAVTTLELGAGQTDTTLSRSAAGVLAVEGVVIPSISSTNTITNKRPQPRTASSTTASTLTPDLSSANVYFRTTQTATLTINAPTGTPVIGETIAIYVDSAGAQTLTIDSTYKVFGAAFPATSTAGKTFMLTAQFNGTDGKALWANAV